MRIAFRALIAVLAAGFLAVGLAHRAAAADASGSVVGLWLIQDRNGVIAISRCGSGICGKIVGMSDTNDTGGRPSTDNRGLAKCNLTILQAAERTDDGRFEGLITNPNDGSRWNCEVWTEADGLHLRGYVLLPLLGQTQVWTRYTGKVTPDCRMTG